MSIKSVRSIILTSLMNGTKLDDIVEAIHTERPESQAGLKEVKWYISKLKKDGYLNENAMPTEKGSEAIAKIMFRSSKTLKPAGGSQVQEIILSKVEQAKEYFDYAISDKGDYKLRDASLKRACKVLEIPYEKKNENKAQRISRVANHIANNK